MKYIAVSAFMVATLLALTSCNNIVTVHEYHSGKPDTQVDTVCVIVNPEETPDGQWGGSAPDPQEGSSGSGEYVDPWTTYYSLYDGAVVETSTYQSGRTRHTLLGNSVTGSGPGLEADARVWRNGDNVEDIMLILEFEPSLSRPGTTEGAPVDVSRSRSESASVNPGNDPPASEEARFLHIRSGDERYSFDMEDCSSIDVDETGDQMAVEVVIPVSLALLRDISHSCSVSFTVSWPGTGSFTKYFTEMNDGNMYQYYTLFVVGEGNPTLLPVER